MSDGIGDGRVAVVTGGGTGLGQACVQRLLAADPRHCVWDGI